MQKVGKNTAVSVYNQEKYVYFNKTRSFDYPNFEIDLKRNQFARVGCYIAPLEFLQKKLVCFIAMNFFL